MTDHDPKPRRSSGWRSAESITAPKRPPTKLEAQAIAEVHELAFRLDLGDITLAEIRAATDGRQRHLATRFTSPDDPAFRPLMAMLDALIADDARNVVTDHGVFNFSDLLEVEMKVRYEDGRDVIVLPVLHPWRIPPDKHGGGVRADPVYRSQTERGPAFGSFGAGVQSTPQRREPAWWEIVADDQQETKPVALGAGSRPASDGGTT